MPYIAISPLQREQNKLTLNLISYDLSTQWNSHELITSLRRKLYDRMPSGLFDPQDLEHQVLFRLTTYEPSSIDDQLIDKVIEEQLAIINHRLEPIKGKLPYLFRGLSGQSRDLNFNRRLELKSINGSLVAIGDGCTFEVEFKKIDDNELIELFTEKLHYIHVGRHKGDTFGLFFKGDSIPWGVETTEPSIITKRYKKDSLLAHGIDPYKAVEITRLYLLPGSPTNSISILDGLVSRYYRKQGIEAMYTTTMPTYAKTKGATTAGGMKNVLLVKELSHKFTPIKVDGKTHYVHSVNAAPSHKSTITTHLSFPTLYTVETYMLLNKNREIKPLDILKARTIFVADRNRREIISRESKFVIKSTDRCIQKLNEIAKYRSTFYMYDQFWGEGNKPKLRLRKIYHSGHQTIEVDCKYRISAKDHIRTEIREKIYEGTDLALAESKIRQMGKYAGENSYEKVRITYSLAETNLRLDICPFGTFLEIEGDDKSVKEISKLLDLDQSQSTTATADEIYLEWAKTHSQPELWNVRFGLEEPADD